MRRRDRDWDRNWGSRGSRLLRRRHGTGRPGIVRVRMRLRLVHGGAGGGAGISLSLSLSSAGKGEGEGNGLGDGRSVRTCLGDANAAANANANANAAAALSVCLSVSLSLFRAGKDVHVPPAVSLSLLLSAPRTWKFNFWASPRPLRLYLTFG